MCSGHSGRLGSAAKSPFLGPSRIPVPQPSFRLLRFPQTYLPLPSSFVSFLFWFLAVLPFRSTSAPSKHSLVTSSDIVHLPVRISSSVRFLVARALRSLRSHRARLGLGFAAALVPSAVHCHPQFPLEPTIPHRLRFFFFPFDVRAILESICLRPPRIRIDRLSIAESRPRRSRLN